MSFLNFCNWIENSTVGAGVKNSIWIFPVVESIHILGIVLLVFTVALVDLRVLGWASPGGDLMRRRPLGEIAGKRVAMDVARGCHRDRDRHSSLQFGGRFEVL